ncbi:MAG: Fic family protein, partial [Candidatus Sericytochromatia bacterium]|nr:Fic family protein [Candidatus Tanganyikabacteria bacterium]
AVEHLIAIHESLFIGTRLDRIAGQVRDAQNWVGGDEYSPRHATYIPPPEGLVPDLLVDLCEFVTRTDFPPIIQAAIAHAQFETIHPFPDGNGRVGRALIHVVARRRGMAPDFVPPVSIALAKAPLAYISGLKAFERGEIGDWCKQFAEALTWSCEVADELLDRLVALQAQWSDELRPRAKSALAKLLPSLPELPVLDVRSAAATIGASEEAARLAIADLEAAGILLPTKLGKLRRKVWRAPAILDALDTALQFA